jgi:hypothetical protein
VHVSQIPNLVRKISNPAIHSLFRSILCYHEASKYKDCTQRRGPRRWVERRSCGMNSPNKGRLRLAAGISKIQDQREVAIVNGNAGDIDDAGDALLDMCEIVSIAMIVIALGTPLILPKL